MDPQDQKIPESATGINLLLLSNSFGGNFDPKRLGASLSGPN